MDSAARLQTMLIPNVGTSAGTKEVQKKEFGDQTFRDLMVQNQEVGKKQPTGEEQKKTDKKENLGKPEESGKTKKENKAEDQAISEGVKKVSSEEMILLSELIGNDTENSAQALQLFLDTATLTQEPVSKLGSERVPSLEQGMFPLFSSELEETGTASQAMLEEMIGDADWKDLQKSSHTSMLDKQWLDGKNILDKNFDGVSEKMQLLQNEEKAEEAPVLKMSLDENVSKSLLMKESTANADGKDLNNIIARNLSRKEESEITEDALTNVAVLDEAQKKVKMNGEETIEIKVADPYMRLNQNAVEKVADKITNHILAGKNEFQIQLNPENLGKIQVKISMLDEGIKVIFSCENQKTCNLLSDRAGALNQIVEHNTGNPVEIEVKEDYWNQQKDAADQHSNQNQRQEESRKQKSEQTETEDFIHQLRLGMFNNQETILV